MAIVLNETDVKAVLPMRDLIDAMEGALAKFSAGEIVQPVRSVLQVGPSKAFFGVMPAYQPAPAALGAKLVTVFAGNTAHGLPTHLATIILLDPDTGALAALMDGRFYNRGSDGSGFGCVSATHGSSRAAGRATLAILGSGVQARSHLEAIALVRRLKEIRVWSPTPVNRDRFAREMASHAPASIRAVSSARAAVDGADIIVLATASPTPVVERGWAADGAHICAVGACRPDVREMDGPLVAAGRLIVDSRAGALAEAGDLVLAIKEGCCGRITSPANLERSSRSGCQDELHLARSPSSSLSAWRWRTSQRRSSRGAGLPNRALGVRFFCSSWLLLTIVSPAAGQTAAELRKQASTRPITSIVRRRSRSSKARDAAPEDPAAPRAGRRDVAPDPLPARRGDRGPLSRRYLARAYRTPAAGPGTRSAVPAERRGARWRLPSARWRRARATRKPITTTARRSASEPPTRQPWRANWLPAFAPPRLPSMRTSACSSSIRAEGCWADRRDVSISRVALSLPMRWMAHMAGFGGGREQGYTHDCRSGRLSRRIAGRGALRPDSCLQPRASA